MKYIDTDKLLNKIEELKKEHIEFAQKRGYSSLGNAARIQAEEDDKILSIVTSLQQEADLEREAVMFCFDNGINITPRKAKEIACHFAEWGAIHLNTRKEE